jgi:tetratricopeptide (TPR) repeat protein
MKANLAYQYYFYTGRINSFVERSSEALRIAQEGGDPISIGMSQVVYGIACFTKGCLRDAENHSLEGRNICERIGLYSWKAAAYGNLAETYFEMKEYQKSWEFFQQGKSFLQRVRFIPSWARWAELGAAMSEVMLGKRDVALEYLGAIPKQNRYRVLDGWVCRFLGEILLNLGGSHITEAEQWIRSAIEADDRNGMRFHLGLDHALYGEFFKRQGDRSKAQVEFGKSIEILRECGADGWVKKYERELVLLSQ